MSPRAHNTAVVLAVRAAGVVVCTHGFIGQIGELFGRVHALINQKRKGAPPNTNTILNLLIFLIRKRAFSLGHWSGIEERRN
jgi:hypothetical protein